MSRRLRLPIVAGPMLLFTAVSRVAAAGDEGTHSIWPDWLTQTLNALRHVWEYHLFTVGDDQKIRVHQIVVALLVLLVGFWLSRRMARIAARRLMRHSRLDANTALLIQRVINYTALATIVVLALDMVGVPITAFAFLGGALAIGLGFGAQNVLNNFISGLILMVERPIRLNDLVEIGQDVGRVEVIGARSTRIRRTDGIDILVPNSKLLEENVTNWTHSDNRIRTKVIVGVAYGSPTQTVTKLLEQATVQHERVLSKPKPIVIFDEFGDNALIFEVYFWGEIEAPMDLKRLKSDVRVAIDKAFREADITISFPQRDVHLDTLRPLEVRVNTDK